MYRAWDLTDLLGYVLLGFVVYKSIELGPYETALLFGRMVRVFTMAVQGYL